MTQLFSIVVHYDVDTRNSVTEAAISNDNNSEEAKGRARDRLEQMAADGELGEEARQAQVKTGHKVVYN